jgi:hypothetical protein
MDLWYEGQIYGMKDGFMEEFTLFAIRKKL